jgi:beta-phosphoglucomutase-like phosphatase (HAD superfamily)
LGYAEAEWGVEMAVNFQGGIVDSQYKLEKNFYDRKVMIDKFWRAWELRLNELCSQVQACAGATEIVEGLRKLNMPMAIATSSRMDSVNRKKQKHEKMFRSFQHIVCGDDPCVKNGKPAPDIYLEAAKRLGVHPSECLVFEDALTGAQAGKLAGCHVVAVPDPRMERESFLHVADEIIESLLQFSGQRWGIPLELCP